MFTYWPFVGLLLLAVVGTSETVPFKLSSVTYLSNKYASLKQFQRRVSHSVNGLLSKTKLVRKIESPTSTTITTTTTESPSSWLAIEEMTTLGDSETTTEVSTTKPTINCTDFGILNSLLRMRLVGIEFTGPFDGSEMLLTTDVFPHPPKIISLDPIKKVPRPPTPSSYQAPPKSQSSYNVATLRSFWERLGLPGVLADRLEPQLAKGEGIQLFQPTRAHTFNGKHIHLNDLFKKRRPVQTSNVNTLKQILSPPLPPPSPRSRNDDTDATDAWIQLLKGYPAVKIGKFNGVVYNLLALANRGKRLRNLQREWIEKGLIDTESICPPETSHLPLPASDSSAEPSPGERLSRALELVDTNL